MGQMDALKYIRDSTFIKDDRYKWIKPLIDKRLNNQLNPEDIEKLIDCLIFIKEDKNDDTKCATDTEMEVNEASSHTEEEDNNIDIRQIVSIECVRNVGLIDISDPLGFEDGLNVFYGKNGAGKSSIYLALCKLFGKEKDVFSNINGSTKSSSCHIRYKGSDGQIKDLTWETGRRNNEANVRIFDNEISNFLVENDQVNEFEIAHLKIEYFSFLRDMLDNVGSKLKNKLVKIEFQLSILEENLKKNVDFVFSNGYELKKDVIEKAEVTKEENELFKEIEHKIKVIETDSTEAVIKNLNNAKQQVTSILDVFGMEDKKISPEGKENAVYSLKYDIEYLRSINKEMQAYLTLKKAFNQSGSERFAGLIPADWISQPSWQEFIASSIKFIKSIDHKLIDKYTEETCIYCHQPLQTDEAKGLIKAYQELQEELEEKIKIIEKDINKNAQEIQKIMELLDEISEKNKIIQAEFSSIGKNGEIDIDVENIKQDISGIYNSLTSFSNIDDVEKKAEVIGKVWGIYLNLYNKFNSTIRALEKAAVTKAESLKNLYGQIQPLSNKKNLVVYKQELLQYVNLFSLKKKAEEYLSDITALKQNINTLETRFTRDETLKKFKEFLLEEYKSLNFNPPEVWEIKPSTRNGINKRVYSLKDKKLSDIFSEGEKKIHAIADFLAQSELNQYKGVFIFDDPVNSMDEEKMECVRDRIIKLVEQGNQVIVFTHNLVFLNLLVDTQNENVNRISRLNNQVIIEKQIKLGAESGLKSKLEEISKRMEILSKRKEGEISVYEIRNVYDLMSGYIEDFVEHILLKDVISRYRPNIRMNSLHRLKDFDVDIIDGIIGLYEKTSRKGSRHSHPTGTPEPKYSELLQDVKELTRNFNYKTFRR